LLEKEFYPKLELLFKKYDVKDYNWSIPILELNLPKISKKNWKNELINHSLIQMEEYLKNNRPVVNHTQPSNVFTTPITIYAAKLEVNNLVYKAKHAANLFFGFLESGLLIENSISKKLDKVLNEIAINVDFINQLIEQLKANPTQLIRWIFSVPDAFKKKIINSITDFPKDDFVIKIIKETNSSLSSIEIKQLKQKLQKNNQLTSQWVEFIKWNEFLIQKVASKRQLFEEFIRLTNYYWDVTSTDLVSFSNHIIKKTINEEFLPKTEAFFKELKEHIKSDSIHLIDNEIKQKEEGVASNFHFISNSGLVLFHPFLTSLFEQLKLTEKEQWKSIAAQHKAILITQHLITGQVKFLENELVLNKIICGLPIDDEVNTKLKITKAEKEKCKSLLNAIREYWKPMNNSSIEALQETFLIRDGKLELTHPNSYELWVEEKGYDILLGQLPWGIGMIKTPWMDVQLNCQWN
jgi:hypothetical protein